MAREDILRLWSTLDHKPESAFELVIMKAADHMEFVLSEENMEKLSKIKAQVFTYVCTYVYFIILVFCEVYLLNVRTVMTRSSSTSYQQT